ncbi:PREDICTED: uncharacterized protein LOC109591740, partial [Amphimedon queenslandica]|uniref:Uncharacterized protein n=1 Tax=Amphimedon queenslandica TaxID=400682 RepID=A0AAN0K1B6_AMPQE
MVKEEFGQDPAFKVVHIGLDENSYFRLMTDVGKLEMFIVRCDNLETGIGLATDTGFSKLARTKDFNFEIKKLTSFGDFLLCFDDNKCIIKSFDERPCTWFNVLLQRINLIKTHKPLLAHEPRPNDEL